MTTLYSLSEPDYCPTAPYQKQFVGQLPLYIIYCPHYYPPYVYRGGSGGSGCR